MDTTDKIDKIYEVVIELRTSNAVTNSRLDNIEKSIEEIESDYDKQRKDLDKLDRDAVKKSFLYSMVTVIGIFAGVGGFYMSHLKDEPSPHQIQTIQSLERHIKDLEEIKEIKHNK